MDIRCDSYDHLPRYLATRVDQKTGPVKLSATAKRSRTIAALVEHASFIRTGKTGTVLICVCFEELIPEEPVTFNSPSPLPTRTKVKKELKEKGVKKERKDPELHYPDAEGKVSYGTRKRAISQLSSPQTKKTPPPSEPEFEREEPFLSDVTLPEEDTVTYDTPPYNLRKGPKKRGV